MDKFISVYLLWISIVLALIGLAVQAIRLIKGTRPLEPLKISGEIVKDHDGAVFNSGRNFFMNHDMFLFWVSVFFHIILIFLPFFVLAHSELFYISWGIHILYLPDWITDLITLLFMVSFVILLIRRLVIPEMLMLIRPGDIAFLIATAMPFITGFLAYHGTQPYRPIIYLHILSGELLIMMTGWTRLGHAVFFICSRFFIAGEYSIRKGRRDW